MLGKARTRLGRLPADVQSRVRLVAGDGEHVANAHAGAVRPALEGRWTDALAAVELEAGRRDPYRGLSRVFHLIGHKRG